MFIDIEGILDSAVLGLIRVVEFKEVMEVLQVVEDAIIPQEMHDVLIVDSELFLFVLLLVLENEIVKEDLIQSVEIFLYQKLDPLDR